MFRSSLAVLVAGLLGSGAATADFQVQGRVVDQGGLALPGAAIVATTPAAVAVATAIASADGSFTLELPAGDYRVEASLDGFEPAGYEFRVAGPLVLPDLVLTIGGYAEETTVVATLPTEVQAPDFGAPATIAEEVFDNAPTRNDRYDDVLPLLPNVVRGPDGLISVAGARAPEGVVLLNGVPWSDVAAATPVAAIPLEAIQAVQVITSGFAAEHGPTTGGVTVINTRSGADRRNFSINSFIPRVRLADSGVRGIEAWNPKGSLRGPIAPGKAWFAQSLDYNWEKTRAYTRAGTQDRRQKGFSSLTQVDGRVGDGHAITVWLNGQQTHVNAEGLNAFNPLGTVPALERNLWGGALIDRVAFGTSTLETRLAVRHQDTSLGPAGTDPYVVGHDITRGSYFHTFDRHAVATQASTVVSRIAAGPSGNHLVKAGGSVAYRKLEGSESSRPVTYLRSNGKPARIVEFAGAGTFDADSVQAGAFVEDGWELPARVRLDAGFRFDHDSRMGTAVGPRVGVTWSVDADTTVSAGGGWFTADTPLAALAFDGYQERRVTFFDEQGAAIGPAVTYRSVLSGHLSRPRARIWSGRVDRRLGNAWQLRVALQERRGTNEAIVTPVSVDGETVALLSTTGESRIRSIETTAGYRPAGGRHQLYLSYVRSHAEGNTNDFGQVEGLFKDARLARAEVAPLPSDVPHRVLVWGVFQLSLETTVAPFLEARSGFPFSAIGDDWSYAERRFGRRYPLFASLDLVVNKIVTLPGGMRARVGFKLYNIAGRKNGRDVQANVTSTDFGDTYNPLGRQVRGVFELIWGGNKR